MVKIVLINNGLFRISVGLFLDSLKVFYFQLGLACMLEGSS